jgi:hypothetical protein
LPPNSSFNILLFDPGFGSVLQSGWSLLSYDSLNTRLGGFPIFQEAFSVGTFEALVPLSGVTDNKFYMPFDNRAGFATSIVNPNTTPTTVSFHLPRYQQQHRGDSDKNAWAPQSSRVSAFGHCSD